MKKKIIVSLSLALSLVMLFTAFNFVFFANKIGAERVGSYSVPIKNNISIDGNLSDWDNTTVHSVTKGLLGQTLDYSWNVSIAWNGIDTLYLNANVTYPWGMGGPYASRPDNSPTWYEDDVITLVCVDGNPLNKFELYTEGAIKFYGWSSKVNFVAEDTGGLCTTKAEKSAWVPAPDGIWGIETSIKLSDAIVKQIKNGQFVYMNILNSCVSGGAEKSVLGHSNYGNVYGSLNSIWEIDLLNKFVFETGEIEITPTPTLTPAITKVSKVKLNKSKITLKQKKKYILKAKITPTNATNKKVKWSVGNKKIAKVSSKGKVTALRPGKTKITAKVLDGSGKKASCTVVVKKAKKK